MLTLLQILHFIFQVYTFMLFARILSSWLPQLNEYKIMQFINYYTNPYLNFFRSFIPPLGMMDFSPIVAFLCLSFIENIIVSLLMAFVR